MFSTSPFQNDLTSFCEQHGYKKWSKWTSFFACTLLSGVENLCNIYMKFSLTIMLTVGMIDDVIDGQIVTRPPSFCTESSGNSI